METIKNTSKLKHHKFESVTEFVDYSKKFNSPSKSENPNFNAGLKNSTEAQNMVNTGWTDNKINKIFDVASAFGSTIDEQITDELVPDVCGPVFNLDAIVQGEPEICYNFGEGTASKPVVKIACQVCAQGYFEQIHFFNRGSAIIGLIESLEVAGIPVELTAFIYTQGRTGEHYRTDIIAKQSHEGMDKNRLAFVLSHAGFYRLIGFDVSEGYRKEFGEEQGIPSRVHSVELPAEAKKEFDIVTPYDRSFLSSTDRIDKWVTEQVNALTPSKEGV